MTTNEESRVLKMSNIVLTISIVFLLHFMSCVIPVARPSLSVPRCADSLRSPVRVSLTVWRRGAAGRMLLLLMMSAQPPECELHINGKGKGSKEGPDAVVF